MQRSKPIEDNEHELASAPRLDHVRGRRLEDLMGTGHPTAISPASWVGLAALLVTLGWMAWGLS